MTENVTKLFKTLQDQARGWAHIGVSTAASSVAQAAGFLKTVEGRLTNLGSKLAPQKPEQPSA